MAESKVGVVQRRSARSSGTKFDELLRGANPSGPEAKKVASVMKRNGEVVVDLADQIRVAILEGVFKPGDSLREITIITRFGCSRTSAREALRLLIHTGLTEKTPNQSYRVSQFDERDLYELRTLRLQLEQLAGRIAFGREELLQGLVAALEELRDAVARGNKVDAFRANRHFHEAIVAAAGHRRLAEAYARIGDQIEFAFLSLGQLRRDIDRLVAEHEVLVDLARSGTLEDFLAELAIHVQTGLGAPAGGEASSPSRRVAGLVGGLAIGGSDNVSGTSDANDAAESVGHLGW